MNFAKRLPKHWSVWAAGFRWLPLCGFPHLEFYPRFVLYCSRSRAFALWCSRHLALSRCIKHIQIKEALELSRFPLCGFPHLEFYPRFVLYCSRSRAFALWCSRHLALSRCIKHIQIKEALELSRFCSLVFSLSRALPIWPNFPA